ncbi:MAG: PAS domain-containing sensor histidine kinase, partial [Erysipelotrichia bacterium]|nr:PAS domain-containing sensor histidine kinase [Erysipelotrichia bacterium]
MRWLTMTDKETSEDSSEQFCMLVKNSPDAYLLIKDKIFIDCNQAAEKMLELQREQIIGFSPAHFAPKYQPDGRSSASAAEEWLSLSSQNGKASFEWMHHRLDGSELFIDVSLSSAVLNGKQVMLVCLHDITARKRAEEALLIFKESLENSTDAIGMSTADGHHYYQNKAFCELFGDTSDYPPDKTYVDKALGNEVFNTIMSGRTWIGEAKMYSKTGQILDILLRAYANKDSNGNITALVGIHTDITARKRAEEDREKLQLHLSQSQKMESIGRLAGGVAHDFNNMLGVILGHAELAIKSLEPTHSLIPALTEIIRVATRSADLTHQLLAFARKQPIVPKVLDLNETVEHTLKMLRRLIGENIDLAWLPGKNLGHIKA